MLKGHSADVVHKTPPLPSSFFFFGCCCSSSLYLFRLYSYNSWMMSAAYIELQGLAFFVVQSFIEIRRCRGISSRISLSFSMESSEVRTVQTVSKWDGTGGGGGPTSKKGRTTRTRGSMTRFDAGYRTNGKGTVKRFVCETSILVSFTFSLTKKRYGSVIPCAHHHLILFFTVKVYPFFFCFVVALLASSDPVLTLWPTLIDGHRL